jgi:hypothetical protein
MQVVNKCLWWYWGLFKCNVNINMQINVPKSDHHLVFYELAPRIGNVANITEGSWAYKISAVLDKPFGKSLNFLILSKEKNVSFGVKWGRLYSRPAVGERDWTQLHWNKRQET